MQHATQQSAPLLQDADPTELSDADLLRALHRLERMAEHYENAPVGCWGAERAARTANLKAWGAAEAEARRRNLLPGKEQSR